MNSDKKQNILEGYRIIDLTAVVFGPYATQILGDLGADVIKIEAPAGDIMRHAGPHVSPGMGSIYLTVNRNKKSVTLDLRQDCAKDVLRRLIKSADGFIHNVRAGGIKRLGFDYEAVKAIKPEIVYLHAVGYGSSGPYAGLPAYDDLVQAVSGSATLLPRQDGSEAPRYYPGVIADKTSGLHAAYAMIAGFLHRERTGRGQFIEVPMMECMVSYTMIENIYGHAFVPPKGHTAYTRSISPQRKPYRTKDGFLAILPYSDDNWRQYFTFGGRPELFEDPRFNTYVKRTENINEIYRLAEEIALTKTSEEWLELLRPASIPCMQVNTLESVLDDPQMRDTGFIEERNHPSEGKYVAINHPVLFSDAPSDIRIEPPLQGQHNDEVLKELGYNDDEIESMEKTGTFG